MQASNSIEIRRAAAQGAFVWWTYTVFEATFSVGLPFARNVLARAAPSLLPVASIPFVSASLTAITLVLFPVLGAVLGGIQAACFALGGGEPRRGGAGVLAWSAVALIGLDALFGVNAVLAGQRAVVHVVLLPLALGFVRLSLAWREEPRPFWLHLTHPVTVNLLLVGGAFIAQPRPGLEGLATASIEVVFAGIVTLLVIGAGVLHPRAGRIHGFPAHVTLVLILFTGLVFAARQTTPKKIILRRPVSEARPHDRRPNVILITLDTVRADHTSICGYARDTTPFLRSWVGSDATLYERSIATSNWTLPTHASILTGLSPQGHGARRTHERSDGAGMSERTLTLAEILSRAGYRTAGIVANTVVLIPQFGFDRGFSEYDASPLSDVFVPGGRGQLLSEAVRQALVAIFEPARRWALFPNADVILERARAFLASAAGGSQPFLLFLNFMDAHAPYVPPAEFAARFPGIDSEFRWASFNPREDDEGRLGKPLSRGETLHLTSQYDGAIAYLDDRLRNFVETLRTLGLYDNSLIVVTADHGEALGDHGYLYHGRSLYQEQVRVPLVVKYPHARKGAVVDALVSAIDILPTILDVVPETAPPGLVGRSLREGSPVPRFVIAESFRVRKGSDPREKAPDEVALSFGSLKRIWKRDGSAEVYDLSADPGETDNRRSDLRLPAEWDVELRRYLASAGVSSPVPATDPEVIRRLRALGYLH